MQRILPEAGKPARGGQARRPLRGLEDSLAVDHGLKPGICLACGVSGAPTGLGRMAGTATQGLSRRTAGGTAPWAEDWPAFQASTAPAAYPCRSSSPEGAASSKPRAVPSAAADGISPGYLVP